MPRYIDAQKLKDAMNIEDDANGNFNIMTALKCVDDAPTADVQEVMHGNWIFEKDIERFGIWDTFICSKCGHRTLTKCNYCSNCGAKMDEEEQK